MQKNIHQSEQPGSLKASTSWLHQHLHLEGGQFHEVFKERHTRTFFFQIILKEITSEQIFPFTDYFAT